MKKIDTIKYILAFIITGVMFLTAFLVTSYFNTQRLENIQSIEKKISLDILSSETQFSLLRDASCTQLSESILSQELNSLASRLDYTEEQLGKTNETVLDLKRYYSLLQIKDFILSQQLAERCNIKPVSIIYFYSNKESCPDCEKQAQVLQYLRTTYPQLRVYAFDYDLELSAIETLTKINKVQRVFPALVLPKGVVLYGFTPIETLETHLPTLATTSPATTTTPIKQ